MGWSLEYSLKYKAKIGLRNKCVSLFLITRKPRPKTASLLCISWWEGGAEWNLTYHGFAVVG